MLLLEELERSGVEVVFLNHPPGASPEEALLVQVQGMVAEYERAKIMERRRRGKRHAARAGVVNVLAGAPYGYRYVSKHEGGGQARFEILLEEARVVRQVFALGGAGTRDHWRGLSPTDPSRGAHADGQDGLGPRYRARYAQEPRLSGGGRHRPRHGASRCAPACGQSLGVRCTRAGRAR